LPSNACCIKASNSRLAVLSSILRLAQFAGGYTDQQLIARFRRAQLSAKLGLAQPRLDQRGAHLFEVGMRCAAAMDALAHFIAQTLFFRDQGLFQRQYPAQAQYFEIGLDHLQRHLLARIVQIGIGGTLIELRHTPTLPIAETAKQVPAQKHVGAASAAVERRSIVAITCIGSSAIQTQRRVKVRLRLFQDAQP
jgi:hypothetical protein